MSAKQVVNKWAYAPFVRFAINYFKNPENQRKFEEWHLETYGETHDEWQARKKVEEALACES